MARPTRLLITVMIGSLLCSPVLAAKFYRWTDDKGVTHYTQTPPPEGTQGKEVRIQGGASSDQDEELQRLEQQRQQAEAERKRQAEQAAEAQREKEKPAEVSQERCEQHRKNLEELRNKPVVRATDPATGEVTTLDADARQKMIDDTLKALEKCD
ncbi:MAG: DUF4124 domain-containing protein [Alcanivoracaceae bacterium]|jgi:hypothetical protein|nr:DUF4124 domain-containing protein [Alcanivoracaceae bacterium]